MIKATFWRYCFRDVNYQTKEYLGFLNSDEQQDESNTSSLNSEYDSDSDDVYQARIIERTPRIAPQIAEPDQDEIYGEFDHNLASQFDVSVRLSRNKETITNPDLEVKP